ncbi:CBS domain containing-hemolysin-like protein [Marinilabilia salmonicolor]|jgi:CBS domain containing-hemolysin-like protein|uniref:CNNM domain-containing protein n=1 Tax=Marinilabilia salmonicolor TaxID=989 RepID=UPI000D0830EB|nr:hemolysin family protein [Marinilabilia salmonicolor]PRY91953.1 CBS domain containing-hemolysin-like protein [Marinilabilia salmonicolor]
MTLLILYLILALGVSFLCSILEAVLFSTTASYIEIKKMQNVTGAQLFANLKTNIDRPISAILSINTIAHTVGAAGVGAQAVYVFGETWFGVISAVLTLLILIVSEIIPKTIGATFWRNLAIPAGYTIRVLMIIAYPLVIFSELITKLMPKSKHPSTVSREEIEAMSSIGAKEGILNKDEGNIILNAMRLDMMRVKEIMTPRTVVVACPRNMTSAEFIDHKEYLEYSRIPVFKKNIDDTENYVLKADVLESVARGNGNNPLRHIERNIKMVPEAMNLRQLFEEMISENEHTALVVNEYGAMEGIVTLEDIIETLIGREIVDETDTYADMQELARERWHGKMKKIYPRFWRR